MYSRILTFIIAFILWSVLSFSLDWQHIIAGLAVSGLVALVMGDMFTGHAKKWFSPKRYLWFGVLMLVFTRECVKANIDVAFRVLSPNLRINPGIVKVSTKLKSETAFVFLANLITLTPGTFSVDIDKENGYLYVHWIDVKAFDAEGASRIIVTKFERILKEVFE